MRKRLGAVLLLALSACGPGEEWAGQPGDPMNGLEQPIVVDNGLSANGLSANGLSANGLSANGLSLRVLSSHTFRNWFDADPVLREEFMRYVIRCAAPQGFTRSFTSHVANVTYTWVGQLGLAPGWAAGAPPTIAEQQVVSACLAAHVNTHGVNVPISVLGLKGNGTPLPIEPNELSTFSETEACFFGNLFNGDGLFAGNDRNSLSAVESTSRACALSPTLSGTDPACPPVTRVGSCQALNCEMDPESRYYKRCTYNGKVYRPITTRIRPQDIYSCGDGVCQITEQCGTGTTATSCQADCGLCP
ncbi:hypothetical protein [Hyalangium rubrum]|uniref:Lipoprotein n=1 Tax=Hyalangium rubrum TaxID=3103134 RepID=A0ABU5HJ24_9BACT|nr:hypothetical protein [Hyalangium sp. s54d21]MDY7232843.1 hypothetical protein [Hyalangium sp. s54d21]